MYRVKVYGPSVSHAFGMDIHEVASPADVLDRNGVLIVTCPPTPARPHPRSGIMIKARRSHQVIYPRGGWTKVILEDIVEDPEDLTPVDPRAEES